jgi:hypothetical protein
MLSPQNRLHRRPSRLVTSFILVAWLAALGLVALNRQNIIDWWRLREYQAPAIVSQLAEQDTMTDYGRRVFFVNQPEIVTKQNFGVSCKNHGGEQTIVLGCYHGGQSGIFLLDVTDSRLDGVEQVTAAHEMLHAAYERLSSKERASVDKMLKDFYKQHLNDPRILKTIEAYKKSEPKDLVNEMHSIFGTEIIDLPVELEQYYRRYFNNRTKVANFAAQYQSEFTSRQEQIDRHDAELDSLRQRIDAAEADLTGRQATINERQAELVGLRNSGSVEAYNAGVPTFNRLVEEYNAQVELIKQLIGQHNDLVARRNAIALEESQLVKELSPSNAAPIKN